MIKIKYLVCILMLAIVSISYAEIATLTWKPTTTNVDGTPLTDLAGYKVYYGIESRKYTESIDVGNVTTFAKNLPDDGKKYYFAVTAYDTSGNESGFSNEAIKTTKDMVPPNNPVGCSVN